MRTTIDLSDALAHEARSLAQGRHTTVRALVEEGLRIVIDAHRRPVTHRLPDLSFGEGGLVGGLSFDDWQALRDVAYEGRQEIGFRLKHR